tara:strand:+ start:94 stop:387 length:294 start_codon:yes stop_codon:yes gene_type:complete
MSNFQCEKCGTVCYDTPNGYITGCEHYPADIRYIDVPKYHEGKRVIESNLEICPLCHDTRTVSTPLQTIKMIIDPEYRTECHKCKVWWHTYKTEFRS